MDFLAIRGSVKQRILFWVDPILFLQYFMLCSYIHTNMGDTTPSILQLQLQKISFLTHRKSDSIYEHFLNSHPLLQEDIRASENITYDYYKNDSYGCSANFNCNV